MNLDPATRQAVIDHILASADDRNRAWLAEYFTEDDNLNQCVQAVIEGIPYKHGFRGYDVQDALRDLGIYPARATA